MALLQSSTFDFLDEHHILFPSSVDDSLYVYDIRDMPPINSRRRKSKGTHCFEIAVSRSLGNLAASSIDLRCNSLVAGQHASPASFHTDPSQRMVSLLINAASDPTDADVHSRREQREVHARASALLAWTKTHPAPPNACVVVPWSAWGPAAARVVAPRLDDTTWCTSKSKFLGSGMRVITPPTSHGDASVVTVTDYHPARVFRGLQAEKHRARISHTHRNGPTQMEGKVVHVDPERDNGRQRPSPLFRSRSSSVPLPTVRTLPPLFNSLQPNQCNYSSLPVVPVCAECP